jgi:hypothetical protein
LEYPCSVVRTTEVVLVQLLGLQVIVGVAVPAASTNDTAFEAVLPLGFTARTV